MLALLLSLVRADPNVEMALQKSESFSVEYSSHLGEGDGYWDGASREVIDTVNCMTWLQWVLAKAYAPSEDELGLYLDAIRYYEGIVSFANRKHYVDRWTMLEPGPLQKVHSDTCTADSSSEIRLELERFRKNHSYSCTLYREEVSLLTIDFLTTERMQSCVDSLQEGYYVVFFIGNDKYMQRWGKHGTMGQVHSMILEKKEEAQIHHASVDFGKVVSEDWVSLAKRLQNVSRGYTIYALDPSWQPMAHTSPNNKYLTCEQNLLPK